MEAPCLDNPYKAASLPFRVANEAVMREDIIGADSAGFDAAVHVIGDKAHRLLLDLYEAVVAANPVCERRFRLIHSWIPAEKELDRAARMGTIKDFTPHHLIREISSLDMRLGPQRARTAVAWHTMIDQSLRFNTVSDWPGSSDHGHLAPRNLFGNMAYALPRQYDGKPAGGWRPEDAITSEEAIRAYAINPAYSSHEEDLKGSITEGKLADVVVLSHDIPKRPRDQLPETRGLCTIIDGRTVYSHSEAIH